MGTTETHIGQKQEALDKLEARQSQMLIQGALRAAEARATATPPGQSCEAERHRIARLRTELDECKKDFRE